MRSLLILVVTLIATTAWGGDLAAVEQGGRSPAPAAASDSYRLTVNVDMDRGTVDGRITARYRHLGDQPITEIRFRLDPNLLAKASSNVSTEILSVSDAEGQELPWRYRPLAFGKLKSDRGQLSVTLPEPLRAGEQTRLDLHYRFSAKWLSGTALFLQDDPYHSLDAWYPKAMSWHGGAWSIDDDRPSDYDVAVELPAELTVASTGEVIQEKTVADRRKVIELRARGVRGFTIYGWPSWKKYHRTVGDTRVSVMLPEKSSRWAEPMLDAAADAIAFFDKTYGKFPTRHLEIVCPGSPGRRAHGSSAACNTVVVWLGGPIEDLYQRLIAHEVAHQYFGSEVGFRRREIAWATIGLGLTMDHACMVDRGLDVNGFRKTMDWFYFEAERRGYDTTLSQPVEKLLKSKDKLWARGWNMSLMHSKAWFVCAMLEDLLGEQAFRRVVREIIAEHAGGVLANKDLIEKCEAVLGEPLDWFVSDWIDGRATLDYAVGSVERMDDGWRVEVVRLGQGRFPVAVVATTESGEKLRQRVDRQKKTNWLEFKTDGKLKSVAVDPDRICPDIDRDNNRWEPSSGDE